VQSVVIDYYRGLIAVWEKGNKTVVIKFPGMKRISEAIDVHVPDPNKKDNTGSIKERLRKREALIFIVQ
jgi:hypothetical protein